MPRTQGTFTRHAWDRAYYEGLDKGKDICQHMLALYQDSIEIFVYSRGRTLKSPWLPVLQILQGYAIHGTLFCTLSASVRCCHRYLMGKAIMLTKTTFLAVLLYAVSLVLPRVCSFAVLKSPRRACALRMMAVKVSR